MAEKTSMSRIIRDVVLTIFVLHQFLKLGNEIVSSGEFRKLPNKQQLIVRRIINERITEGELRKQVSLFNDIKSNLESLNIALTKKNTKASLDWIITIKGLIHQLYQPIFDSRPLTAKLIELENKFKKIVESGKY